MSGDIGRGATRESILFAVHLTSAKDKPHGSLQSRSAPELFIIYDAYGH